MQSPACRDQWMRVLDRMEHTILNNTDDQLQEQTEQDAPDYPYEGEDTFDGMDVPDDATDVPDGHLVHPFRADVDTGPPDVSKPPSKRAQVEEEIEDLPKWPASEHFTEQYPGVTATVLGKKPTIFKTMEAAELENGDNEWALFRNEDEWELMQFSMQNLGQKKIDKYLKLKLVSKQKGLTYSMPSLTGL